MKPVIYAELTEKSKQKKCFLIMENGEWKVCDRIDNLPYKGSTIGIVIEAQAKRIQELEAQNKAMQKQIQKLGEAIDTLIK